MSGKKQDLSRHLHAASIRIACWDRQVVICATALTTLRQAQYLRSVQAKCQLTRLETAGARDVDLQQSIYVWACYDNSSVKQVCEGIGWVSDNDQHALRLCYVAPELASRASIFVESGAQMVVAGLPFLSSSLLSMAGKARVFRDGNHPLTTGLLKRLPWQSIADE